MTNAILLINLIGLFFKILCVDTIAYIELKTINTYRIVKRMEIVIEIYFSFPIQTLSNPHDDMNNTTAI